MTVVEEVQRRLTKAEALVQMYESRDEKKQAELSKQLSMKAPSPGLVALPRVSPAPQSASSAAA